MKRTQKLFLLFRRNFLPILACGFVSLILLAPAPSAAATAEEIDTRVRETLDRFYQNVDGGREFARSAQGLLVMPDVKKGAFIIGGEFGEGALVIDNKIWGYYNFVSGSVGLSIGAQSKDLIIAFMTTEAINAFRGSRGWEAGVDGHIALIGIGAGKRVDTTTLRDPIVGFIFDVEGLMADLSLKGAKFTQVER